MEFVVRLTEESSHCWNNSTLPAKTSDDDKLTCQTPVLKFKERPGDIIVDYNFALFEELEYGYTYRVQIAVKDVVSNDTSSSACMKVTGPDCYTVTNSRNCCQSRCIPQCSPPINVTVVDVVDDDDEDESTAQVTVSWLRPVQHNDNILYYYLEFVNVDTHNNEFFSYVSENSTIGDTVPFEDTIKGVKVNVSYDISVKVFTKPDEPGWDLVHGPKTVIDAYRIEPRPLESTPSTVIVKTQKLFYTIMTISLVGGFLLICVVICLVFCIIKCRRKNKPKEAVKFIPYVSDNDKYIYLTPEESKNRPGLSLKPEHEFPRHRLRLENELGHGHFGIVYRALASGVPGRQDTVTVAVKMLKDNATSYQKEDMLREITLLQEIGEHPNILGILACCTLDEPLFLITDFMEYGDLLHFLWKSRQKKNWEEDAIYELNEKSNYQIARQIARGMVFLSQNKYVHGDLAARNILVGQDLLVKITDFGLANDVYLRGWTELPTERLRAVKWVGLETILQGLCTIESDVWSFGIIMHEIVTRGATPYPGMSPTEVVTALREGYRLGKPDDCPDEMYAIMRQCWEEKPEDRPTFSTLLESIDTLLAKLVDYMDDSLISGDHNGSITSHYVNDQNDEDIMEMTQLPAGFDQKQEVQKKLLLQSTSHASDDSAFSEESLSSSDSNSSAYSGRRILPSHTIIENVNDTEEGVYADEQV
ncbi:fibroblast growth factor receptor 2-like isoform X2 [Glandiceps talaboti]